MMISEDTFPVIQCKECSGKPEMFFKVKVCFFACCRNESGDELHLGSSCRRLELFPEFLDNGEADPRCCHQVHCVYCGHCDDADASIVLFLFHINIYHSTSDTSSTLKWNYQD